MTVEPEGTLYYDDFGAIDAKLRINAVGAQYYTKEIAKVLGNKPLGQVTTSVVTAIFVPEPFNYHDPNAVAIYLHHPLRTQGIQWEKGGYVSGKHAPTVKLTVELLAKYTGKYLAMPCTVKFDEDPGSYRLELPRMSRDGFANWVNGFLPPEEDVKKMRLV